MVSSAFNRTRNRVCRFPSTKLSTSIPAAYRTRIYDQSIKGATIVAKKLGLPRRGRSRLGVVLPHRLWRCYGKLSTSAFRTPGARSRSQISAGTSQTYPLMVTSMMRCGMRESQLPLVLQRSQSFNSNTTVLLPECAEEVGSSRGQQALTRASWFLVIVDQCRSPAEVSALTERGHSSAAMTLKCKRCATYHRWTDRDVISPRDDLGATNMAGPILVPV